MEIEITEQRQKDYLKDPDRCPVCHSSTITVKSDSADWSDKDAWRSAFCRNCNSQWVECFKLWKIDNLENSEDVQSNP